MSNLLQALWAAYALASGNRVIAKQLALTIRQETLNVTAKDIPTRRKQGVDKFAPTFKEEDIGRGYITGEGGYKGKIVMIKLHCARTGLSLLESKNVCEAHFEKYGYIFDNGV